MGIEKLSDNYIIDYFIMKDDEGRLSREMILNFNYIDNNYLSSIEFMQMIAVIEDKYAITFSDEQLKSQCFNTIGGLISIVNNMLE
jgi:acyl carrier protein